MLNDCCRPKADVRQLTYKYVSRMVNIDLNVAAMPRQNLMS